MFFPSWDAELAAELVDEFRIPACSRIKKLSRGQNSAVGIGIGLAARAEITFFDEPSIYSAPTVLRGRLRNVIRLQFLNRWAFIWVVLIVLSSSWFFSLAIYGVVHAAGVDGDKIGYGAQAPLWCLLVLGIQTLAITCVFVALGLIERWTHGYWMDGYFAHLDPLWASGPLAAVFSYFVGCMLAFILGFWFTIVYRLGGVGAVVLSLVGVAGLVVGAVGLVTWFS